MVVIWRRNEPNVRHATSYFLPYGTTAHTEPCPPLYWRFVITHTDTRWDSSGRVISPTQRPLPTQDNTTYTQETNIHVLRGIRTGDPGNQAAADPRLRPRGHWYRRYYILAAMSYCPTVIVLKGCISCSVCLHLHSRDNYISVYLKTKAVPETSLAYNPKTVFT
jgi:hypothetical protein